MLSYIEWFQTFFFMIFPNIVDVLAVMWMVYDSEDGWCKVCNQKTVEMTWQYIPTYKYTKVVVDIV